MIIDTHTHIHPLPRFESCKDSPLSLDALLDSMNRCGVLHAVLLPIAPFTSNQCIYEACRRHPELIGFASVDLHEGTHTLQTLDFAVQELRLKGLKLHPRFQGIRDCHLDLLTNLARRASHLDIPILYDAFFYGAASYSVNILKVIAHISQVVPQAKIIIAHMGGLKVLEATLMAKENRNILLDVSFSPLYFEGSSVETDLCFAMKKLGAGRLLYGSDFPHMEMGPSVTKIHSLMDKAGFSAGEQDRVMGENAMELLGI